MAKHNNISITKKDGTTEKITGWKADAVMVSLLAVLGAGVYTIGKTVAENGKQVIASIKK